MAEDLDDGEFWLPPKFLSEDTLLMELNNITNKKESTDSNISGGGFHFSCGLGLSRPNSDLSSPGDSLICSTETTETDEDDFLYGLTQKLTLNDDDLWKVDNKVTLLFSLIFVTFF